mgnify:CR=1 FL=1
MSGVRPVEAAPVGTCKDFLPESEDLGGAATPASAGRLLVGGGARKEEDLGRLKDVVERYVYVVATLLLPCSRPCNSFSANIAT